MGLDTSHGCWRGSYSLFSAFRNAIARAAGYRTEMVVYGGGLKSETPMIDWGHLPEGHPEGIWPELPDDPLLVLIAHSDCDGVIKSEHCDPIADRILEVMPYIEDKDGIGLVKRALEFVDGLRTASALGEDVTFG